jgi:hypothetical protein
LAFERQASINPDQTNCDHKIALNFSELYIGLSNGHQYGNVLIYSWPSGYNFCYMFGEEHPFKWPNDAIRPKRNEIGDVYGCGLLLNPRNEWAIFFTFNGVLMGQCPWRQIVLFPV